MRDCLTRRLAGTASGLGAVLAGARWWAVLLVVLLVLCSTYGVVIWLATHSEASRITTFLITWERQSGPFKPPDTSQ
jgi:cell division protein FtsW (lipid II flippase)